MPVAEPAEVVLVGYQQVVQDQTQTVQLQGRRAHWERTVLHMPRMVVVLEQEEKGAKKYRASEQSLEEFGDSAKS